ncbi:MAG: dihydroorotate dehydrogenase electron transfer subunit [Anaerolineae bacterium]|nr:dihydroorotate dehydrogenase electron transfer subunit [Anaerolineae bacterium]
MPTIGIPQPFTITAIKTENVATKTFSLAGSLAAEPGQFVMAWLPGYEDKPFSLANASPIRLTIAAVGPLSWALHRLQVGDSLWLRGPLGRGYKLPLPAQGVKHIALVGGGYGVAPLLFLAREAQALGLQVSAIIGARTAASLLLVEDFTALGLPPMVTTEDGSTGQQGRVTDALRLLLAGSSQRPQAVFACGPVGMLRAVADMAAQADLPIQVGWEAHMRCGIGLCGSCEVGQGWLTCLDGPVFAFNPVQAKEKGTGST